MSVVKKIAQLWTAQEYHRVREEVVIELQPMQSESPDFRTSRVREKISKLADDMSESGIFRRYAYLMWLLNQHVKFNFFSKKDIQVLVAHLAELLKLLGMNCTVKDWNVIAFDYYFVTAEIDWLQGEQFKSFWYQHYAYQLVEKDPPGGDDYKYFSLAVRAFRLGSIPLALEYFGKCNPDSLPLDARNRLTLLKIISFRITGEIDTAINLCRAALTIPPGDASITQELEWELMLAEYLKSRDFTPIMKAIKLRGSHHASVYIVEGILWAQTCIKTHWYERLPTISYLTKNGVIHREETRFLHKVAAVLEELHDEKTSVHYKIDLLAEVMFNLKNLNSIDKEVLCLAAIKKWLADQKLQSLEKLVLAEYTALCLRMTDGKKSDPMDLMAN